MRSAAATPAAPTFAAPTEARLTAHKRDVDLMKCFCVGKYLPDFPSAGRREQHSAIDDGQSWIEEDKEEEEEVLLYDDYGDDLAQLADTGLLTDSDTESLHAGSELDSLYNLSDLWQPPRADWLDSSVNQP
jgi:hypothetical protein